MFLLNSVIVADGSSTNVEALFFVFILAVEKLTNRIKSVTDRFSQTVCIRSKYEFLSIFSCKI